MGQRSNFLDNGTFISIKIVLIITSNAYTDEMSQYLPAGIKNINDSCTPDKGI